jgi:nitroreductase
MSELSLDAMDQVFASARTYSRFKPIPVPDETLERLHQLMQWGPTSFNCQPGRFVFVRSAEGKARLAGCVTPGNAPKVASAPVTVIVAQDTRFQEHLPEQFPHNPDLRGNFDRNAANAAATAFRNSSLQGAYLIIAARMLGLDCGPMSGFDAAALDAAFFPDGRWKSNFLVNLGHGDAESLRPRGPRLPLSTVTTFA